jgi:signal transduction histidine kinase
MHVFAVADNGPGILPADQQKIFHVFRRCENPGTAAVEGKGIGLAVVRSVASNYDGRAWVQSEIGHGSTFFVSLAARCTVAPARQGAQVSGKGLNECATVK